ncbi:MAG: sigma-54 dependent transcriptional regulator [Bdellovibrionota bacterium]
MSGRVLVVDDDLEAGRLLEDALQRRGYEVAAHTSAEEALQRLERDDFDVVLTDLKMRGMNGIDLCTRVAQSRPDLPVVVLTAFGSLDAAVSAIRAGAYDFISKPFETDSVRLVLDRAIQHRALRQEVRRLREAVPSSAGFPEIIGTSGPIKEVLDLIARVADSDASVAIQGESGTGKELVARALHRRSKRSKGPFVALNCAAIPETLLESELFGYEKGAFTDAKASRKGLLFLAEGGTLFLDEVGDLSPGLQVKLLRVLQERKARPLGAAAEIPFDARLVTSTHRDLEAEVEEGRFRQDLFFRLNVVPIHVPPLRARGTDVLQIAQHFLREFAAREGKQVLGLSHPAAEKLLAYSWPGNVRELRNCIERAVALARFDQVTVDDLPEKIRNYKGSQIVFALDKPEEFLPLEEVERRYILKVLEGVGGNKSTAARILGLDRKTLYRKLGQYESKEN